ncbi:MAG: zf-TFIIB domain-containing protein [Usitatibacter sp.]
MTVRGCPSCGEPMRNSAFARRPLGQVELDICFGCQAIWFDQYESSQLTPGGVLELFGAIHEHRSDVLRPLGDALRCPACRQRLAFTQDIERSNRITYYRCAAGHGRFTTFFQFLREKNFVRSLTVAEVNQLKAHVVQVRCSSCGAPVNLERDARCAYCQAPLSILDADAVRKTIAELTEEEQRRRQVDPAAAIDALLAGKRFERKMAGIEGPARMLDARSTNVVDLVGEALDFLMSDT